MWIWTNEVQPPTAGGVVPVQARPFVKVLHANCSLDHVTVIMGCDNFCTLYVNGLVVGTEKNGASTNAQRYTVKFPPTHEVSIAVYAAQDPVTKLAIGLIISGVAWNSNQIKPIEIPFVTDSSWKTFAADDFDVRFIEPHFDVSDWSDALVLGAYGVSPWGSFAIPTTPTTQNGPLVAVTGLPDAPVAGPANVITLNGQ
ncbi:hypothetical protein CVT26_001059 [Gymnopilus dilepis]|uniref:Bacterial alpha-L-rhamnosidase N-terminal domain-containing protein n=1 Tax=Gymnopilus dilepis TaxID=231916 RepID=A0A409WL84_9AGAR|nr:hypothetical protein CVT26_001059 [Gymnopilus dilepis]